MKQTTKEFIGLVSMTTLAFLILTHYTGFAKSVGALGGSTATVIKTLQGRG